MLFSYKNGIWAVDMVNIWRGKCVKSAPVYR